jgi:aryl-alcohol dehydrogenase-like predicted oxidoreductase
MKLKRRIAGRTVGAVGLGCMSFGGVYGATTEDESFACMDEARGLGVDHWDVAEIYGNGLSETLIGRYLAQTRAAVSIATKAGIYLEPERHFRNDAEALRRSLEGSLRRLGRDRVELFYIHRREAGRPIEEVMETLAGLVEEGLIGGIGLSEVAPATLRRAQAVHPVAAVQSEYSLWSRQPDLGMVQTCAELGVTFVAFSPVGRGMLADRFPEPASFAPGDFRARNPRFTEPNFTANMRAIRPFQDWCRARGWSTAAVAVSWTLHRGAHVMPIPGTRTAAHLRDLAQAAEICLTDSDLAEIETFLPKGFAHGARYADAQWPGVEHYA